MRSGVIDNSSFVDCMPETAIAGNLKMAVAGILTTTSAVNPHYYAWEIIYY